MTTAKSCTGQAERWLRWLVGGLSVALVLLFVVTALLRWRYPYELEELEGYVYLTALRVYRGQPIYVRPSLQFIPYMYPPGYYAACAAAGRVMGMSIRTMRAVSIASTLGSFAAIYALVWREVRQHVAALAAVGLYAGCYTVCQCWFDLGRLDSFFVLLVLLALYATRWTHPVVAALVWVLAFQTKQSILPAALVMLCCNWREVRRTVSGLVVLLLGAAGSVLWLDHATRGWYSFYVFAVPRANADVRLRSLLVYWPQEVLRPLLLAVVVIAAAVLLTRPRLRGEATRFHAALGSVPLLFWVVYAHAGSTANAMMPVYAVLAVLFGVSFARLLAWAATLEPAMAQRCTLLLLLAVAAQEAAGVYSPGDYAPSPTRRASLTAAVAAIAAVPGDVYVAQHPYYGLLAQKPEHADMVAIHDALRPADEAVRSELQRQLSAALESQRYSAIVLDWPEDTVRLGVLSGAADWSRGYGELHPLPGVDSGTRPGWMLSPARSAPDAVRP